MNTYAKCAANPCGMRTSKIIELKASCNEHLQKNGGEGVLLLPTGVGCTCSPRKLRPGLYLQPTQTIVYPRREGDGQPLDYASSTSS
jgi:hypothetical protein